MELHRFHRQLAMADAHDHAVFALGRHFEATRELFGNRVKRVITADSKLLRQAFEHTYTAVAHH